MKRILFAHVRSRHGKLDTYMFDKQFISDETARFYYRTELMPNYKSDYIFYKVLTQRAAIKIRITCATMDELLHIARINER